MPAGDVLGEHLGLLPQRRHQAVDAAAVLGAFADHVDIGIGDRPHVIVDHDGALDREPAAQSDFRIGPDAGGDDDHVAVERGAVLEAEPGHPVLAEHFAGELLEMDVDAHRLHARSQDRAAGGVELHLHQMPGEVNDMDLAAVVEEPARRLQAQQAAADHGGASALLRLENDSRCSRRWCGSRTPPA